MPADATTPAGTTGAGGNITIRAAARDDLPRILEIAESYAIDGLTAEERLRHGFLVSGFSDGEYRAFLKGADHFYVAESEDGLIGFVLAYSSERIQEAEWLNRKLVEMHPEPFVLIKQICVDRAATSRGVAGALYRWVFDAAPDRITLTALVADPANERSVTFHQRHGFRKLTEMLPSDERWRSVWSRSPRRRDVLLQQYSIATELYRHEDTLNWSKLANLFYVTAGLTAVLGVSWERSETEMDPVFRAVAFGVSVLGFAAAIAFAVALHWGVNYLQLRKAAAQDVERQLLACGGVPVLIPARERQAAERSGYFEKSPTATMIRMLPRVLAIGWLIVGILVLVH